MNEYGRIHKDGSRSGGQPPRPQPDPLVEVMNAWWDADGYASIETFRAALEARGLAIVSKEKS